MTGFLRSTIILAVVVLIFTMTIQARSTEPEECSEPNEVYNNCGTSCPKTCGDVLELNPPKVCTHECVLGCFCEEGYVRENEEATSPCIPIEDCRPPVHI